MEPHAAATAHRLNHHAVAPERGPPLDNLDILRGLAVLAVVIHHLAHTGFRVPFVGTFGGLLGVQLFFVISGYLITESASKHPWPVYALHRVMRIFPAYWVAFLGFGVAKALLQGNGPMVIARILDNPFPFFLNLVNLQQLHPVALFEFDALSVTWTLTVEMIWYLLAPVMLMLGVRRQWWALAGLLALSIAWTWLAHHHQLDALFRAGLEGLQTPRKREQLFVLINAAFPSQLFFFGLGAVAFHQRQRLQRVSPWPLLALAVAITATIPVFFFTIPCWSMQITGTGMFLLFLFALRAPALKWPFMAWTGKISYSIYLLHMPFIVYGFHKFGHHGPLHLLITLPLIYIGAHLLFRFVEKPGMGLARQWSAALAPSHSALKA